MKTVQTILDTSLNCTIIRIIISIIIIIIIIIISIINIIIIISIIISIIIIPISSCIIYNNTCLPLAPEPTDAVLTSTAAGLLGRNLLIDSPEEGEVSWLCVAKWTTVIISTYVGLKKDRECNYYQYHELHIYRRQIALLRRIFLIVKIDMYNRSIHNLLHVQSFVTIRTYPDESSHDFTGLKQ